MMKMKYFGHKILLQSAFWILLLINGFLAALFLSSIFEAWFGLIDERALGAEALGWPYASEFNYAVTGLIGGLLIVSAILFSYSIKKSACSLLPLLIMPIFVIFLNYYLSGSLTFDGNGFQFD